ncbi:LOW QUALITY PROTEIN: Serine/threonine protein kinase [Trema orientale]|uniref:non-specific serine/threonine protein kinase n=1 Tax=Trema orientale TaxID=63057 RepID=A0A2P5F4D2_TREOI|nr:LOW QUALITY PROTEIN: Serine/threonine protein kinase [Trema orientale]
MDEQKLGFISSINLWEFNHLALLDFKNRITEDPQGIMKQWNESVHFCNWFGITCSPNSERVMIFNLANQNLVGSLPPSIGNLTLLTGINLRFNHLKGEIPREIGRLAYLKHIDFTYNSFGGRIPTNITHCTELRVLDLDYNQLTGVIPDQLSSMVKLTRFRIRRNKLVGTIPAWIGNFSALEALSLSLNNFKGSIPKDLGRLKGLEILELWDNNLSGTVPPPIYNLSSLFYFTFTQNQIQGQLPPDIGITLPNLELFSGGVNMLTGPIPASLSNASGLLLLDFAENGLSGSVPYSLASLTDLIRLNFDDNRLGSGENDDLNILSLLANCTSLEVLGLAGNNFGGELPTSISNLSKHLERFTIGRNKIHGNIPIGMGNLVNLTNLGLEGNHLSGSVPYELGKLQKLEGLNLNVNKFSGPVPSSLGNLTSLSKLFMEENRFEGSIPPSLGSCRNLLILNLSSNNLNGSIPKEVMGISSLSISLTLSNNSLTGSLPTEVGDLNNLSELDVSGNELSGEIPSSLGKCTSLSRLVLKENEFEGTIPEALKSLRGLEEMDLSRNNLSGPVPEFLSKFSTLKLLNLAHNNFEGELSREGVFSNASAVSVLGNKRLCGGIPELRLPACPNEKPHSSRSTLVQRVVIPVVFSVVLVLLLIITSFVVFLMVKRSRRRPLTLSSSTNDSELHISYSDLVELTAGFSEENLIGSGSFGSVYRGVLPGDGKVVAVKVLNLRTQGASKSFFDECKALRSVRHRNLLKIITACSSIDRQGNDFKSLVFEFMANGNLDQWLHPINDERHQIKRLNFIQRLNIAIDVASALEYLHHYCQTPIVHCDLKPSNVLLDHDMVAHVSDFGLASFLFEESESSAKNQTLSVALKGSIGYIPPEYGMGDKVSILGDIYSYGILLLEIFTGKRPTDELFKGGLNIHQFTAMALPDHVMDIVDPSLSFEEYDDVVKRNENDKEEEKTMIEDGINPLSHGRREMEECLVSVTHIGLLCSNVSPRERLHMNVVVNKLQAVRDSYIKFKKNKQNR